MPHMPDTQTQLVNILYRGGQLTEADLKKLQELSQDGRPIEEVLGEMVDEEAVAQAKGKIYSVPYKDLREHVLTDDLLGIVSAEVAKEQGIIPIGQSKDQVEMALVNPGDLDAAKAADYAAKKADKKLKMYVASQASFDRAFEGVSGTGTRLETEIEEVLSQAKDEGFVGIEGKEEEGDQPQPEDQDIEKVVKSAPVSEIVASIIRHAVAERASDIHIEPTEEGSRVRYRVDGVLKNALDLPAYIHPAVISRIKVLSNMKLDETRKPQDGRMRLEMGKKKVDFRVSTLPVVDNEKVALRILDTSVKIESLAGLGFRKDHVEIIEKNTKKAHGFMLVTGPTGSGKTTTLYAVLQKLNDNVRNIVTLEDPIEYYLDGVNQSQIHAEIGFTFATGLRSILRQDPNVIMVGEIRDNETAELAVHASLTGHLVLSTLHTSDVFGTIPRLIDMGIEPFLVASTINLVMAQRLVRRTCPDCRVKVRAPHETEAQIRRSLSGLDPKMLKQYKLDDDGPLHIFRGKGCRECGNSGYRDRVVIAELFENDKDLQKIIIGGFKPYAVKEYFAKKGYLTLTQDGWLKVLEGLTTVEEVLRVTKE